MQLTKKAKHLARLAMWGKSKYGSREDAERFQVVSAAYRLGGAEAVIKLLAPREEIACPRCGGNGEDPDPEPDEALVRMGILAVDGGGQRCELCSGSGIITYFNCRDVIRRRPPR